MFLISPGTELARQLHESALPDAPQPAGDLPPSRPNNRPNAVSAACRRLLAAALRRLAASVDVVQDRSRNICDASPVCVVE